ncbi:hypothetical protein [Arsenicibacter rosenii]|uniref:Glycerophosphoryl diester phosphodiesterase membrane domain-containing protein n=1 Tax=Arsenicibacter rosenii TaxID=1750698 RepID=A0A1S2VIP4_9BACT|nr:hypothetical protein [Arsenicibacter rosenii]OIN57718.1 hypothetical protein BLX24_18405 [Arsenicibacter rosenii]
MITLFQQRDFGEKINATFTFIGREFKPFITSLLYIVGPLALATGITAGIYQSNILALNRSQGSELPFDTLARVFSPAYFLMVFFSILSNILVNLTTYSYMKLYHERSGGVLSVSDVWDEVRRHIVASLLFSFISFVAIAVASVFFLIPGLYVGVALSLGIVVLVFEETDFGATWSRCFQLIRDKWWSTFGLILIMFIIVMISNLVFSIPAGIVSMLVSMKLVPDMPSIVTIMTNTLSTVGSTLMTALLAMALGFQYTNLVERHHGTGLLSAIDSIGSSQNRPNSADEGEF